MSFFKNPEKTKGKQRELWIADERERELLKQILAEIKKMNLQLEIITNERIKEIDNGS